MSDLSGEEAGEGQEENHINGVDNVNEVGNNTGGDNVAVNGDSGGEMDGNLENQIDYVSHLPPDHPLLKRIQDSLSKQLQAHKERLKVEIRTKDEELKLALKKRDEYGVELYGVQQQLARLHQNLEKAQSGYEEAKKKRDEVDSALQGVVDLHKKSTTQSEESKLKYDTQRSELEKSGLQLRQIEQHDKQLDSQIKVAKRTALKAEEDITSREKAKSDQDLLLDSLHQQLKNLEQERGLYDAQIASQRNETQGALQILQEASSEMEGISAEKKQLLAQWKSSLVGLTKRDETLKDKENAIRALQQELIVMENEMNGYKTSIKAEQDKNEALTQILNKSSTETEFLQKKIAAINERREALTQEYSQLQRALESAESELAKVTAEKSSLEEECNLLKKQGDQVVNETVKLEAQIRENLQVQLTLEKSSASTEAGMGKLSMSYEEKQLSVAQLQNELSRMRVDSLTTQAHIQVLEQQLADILNELRQKDSLIEKYEVEIRRRNDEIERKQTEVDRLNRKYDQLMSNIQDENTGPLEATIHNLNNEIAAKRRECSDLQHYWLRAQTELVGLSKTHEELLSVISDLKSRFTIMTQKQMRLTSSFITHSKEIREIENSIYSLRNGMQKLNDLIAKNTSLQAALAEENLFMETEFMCQLRELQSEAIQLEDRIEMAKREKDRLIQDILEAENMRMLWEKKIQLGKETQEALDPAFGAAEHKAMRKEINRMSLKLTQMKREQEQLIQEMERAISRRESFMLRGLMKPKGPQAKAVATAQIKKGLNDLMKQVKHHKKEASAADEAADRLNDELTMCMEEVDHVTTDNASLRSKGDAVQKIVDTLFIEKQLRFDETTSLQQLVKKYTVPDIDQKMEAREGVVDRELVKHVEKGQKIEQLFSTLKQNFPKLQDDLGQLANSTKPFAASSSVFTKA